MRVTEIKTTLVHLPLKSPMKWAGGTREFAPSLVVQLETDEGEVGLGECVGPTLAPLETMLHKELKPFVVGHEVKEAGRIIQRMEEYTRNWNQLGAYAIAGLEMALWDLVAKQSGQPLCQLFGVGAEASARFVATLFIDEPARNAQLAREHVEAGFRELKLKVGRNLTNDVETLAAIRDAVGYEVPIRVDANMAWNPATAVRCIKALEPYEPVYVEQPTPDWDLDGMAHVRRSVATPIAADESCTTVASVLELLDREACDVFVVYVSEAGGLTHAREIAAIADAAGKWCVMGSWAELGIATAAACHVVQASRPFVFSNDSHQPLFEGDILESGLTWSGDVATAAASPGLGVTIDPELLASFADSEARDSVFFDDLAGPEMPRVGQIL